MEKEIWKDIKGFEGQYRISSFGRLQHYTKRFGWNILKNTNKKGWYFNVNLRQGSKTVKSIKIHRLVAEAFIPNPNGYKCINHIDENKQNNHVSNLEWCSYKQNSQKFWENRFYAGEIMTCKHIQKINNNLKKNSPLRKTKTTSRKKLTRIYSGKKVVQFSLSGEFIKEYDTCQQAFRETGVCARNILQVANKTPYNKNGDTRKQAGGFIWKLSKEVV